MGDFGIYQTVLFFLICLPASLPSAFSAFNQPFVVGEPVHNCKFPTNREDLKPIAGFASQVIVENKKIFQNILEFILTLLVI